MTVTLPANQPETFYRGADRIAGFRNQCAPGLPVREDRSLGNRLVVSGEGTLTGEAGNHPVRRGDTLLVPHAAGPLHLTGAVEVLRPSAG